MSKEKIDSSHFYCIKQRACVTFPVWITFAHTRRGRERILRRMKRREGCGNVLSEKNKTRAVAARFNVEYALPLLDKNGKYAYYNNGFISIYEEESCSNRSQLCLWRST